MKRLFLFFTSLMLMITLTAQTQPGVVLSAEDLSKLDPAVKAQIENLQSSKKINETIETAGKFAGLGKEIGTAVNESLTAITTTASNFAETKLGKYTMFLVAYKVLGTDFLQLVIGLLWIIIIIIVSGWVYQKNRDRRVLVYKKWVPEGKGWERKYETIEGDDDFRTFAVVMLCVGLLISLAIIFI